MWRDWNKTAGQAKFEGGDLDHGEDPPRHGLLWP